MCVHVCARSLMWKRKDLMKKNIAYLYQQLLFASLRYPVGFEFGYTNRP